jgi:hypothetical protein
MTLEEIDVNEQSQYQEWARGWDSCFTLGGNWNSLAEARRELIDEITLAQENLDGYLEAGFRLMACFWLGRLHRLKRLLGCVTWSLANLSAV